MCKVISNRIIIGNYLIESIKNDQFSFSLDEFDRFDELLSPILEKNDYYSSFDDEGITDFVEEYSSIIRYDSDSDRYYLEYTDKNHLINTLYRNFRIGVTKPITSAISEVSTLYWGANA